ncbi:M15 family metallopeptidase [Leptothermofonsia sp. ETS-13]|uniref:M15 family metallopeptidase n=1 Tax=Leptothermofonsia sp. ETS-13 TaxID=3035696 RepID=UPI003BA350A7
MDNTGTSEKTPRVLSPPGDDIPVALRVTPQEKPKSQVNVVVLAGSLSALGLAALVSGVLFSLRVQQTESATVATASPAPVESKPSPTASPISEILLGHFAYPEAPRSELAPITDDGRIKLRKAAAKAYREMAAAALQEGVVLVPISGFRSIDDQQKLYFDVKAERGQVAEERAKVSAPPGYSEHHTGYAVDIGDGNTPATHLSVSFEKTAAFQWLKANAAYYSFELSFPKGNKQGVSYEPWHWRYAGDIQSLKTFYKARDDQKQLGDQAGEGEP